MTEFLAKTEDARSLSPGGEGQPTDRTPLQVGREPLATPDLCALSQPANVRPVTTIVQDPKTTELHIVVAAIGGITDRAFIGYTAVSAPMTWTDAQAMWTKLEDERRTIFGSQLQGRRKTARSHILSFAVRSVADPRFAPLVGKGYATTKTEKGKVKAAKAWAKAFGYKGAGGGWINDPSGNTVTQGWWHFANICENYKRIAEGSDGRWYVIDTEMVS